MRHTQERYRIVGILQKDFDGARWNLATEITEVTERANDVHSSSLPSPGNHESHE
jgi:hypothetical protein